jgi:hypothetical protein
LADQVAENVRRLGLHNPRAKQDRYIRILSAVAGCLPGTGDDAETVIERAQVELLSRRTDTGGARAASP